MKVCQSLVYMGLEAMLKTQEEILGPLYSRGVSQICHEQRLAAKAEQKVPMRLAASHGGQTQRRGALGIETLPPVLYGSTLTSTEKCPKRRKCNYETVSVLTPSEYPMVPPSHTRIKRAGLETFNYLLITCYITSANRELTPGESSNQATCLTQWATLRRREVF